MLNAVTQVPYTQLIKENTHAMAPHHHKQMFQGIQNNFKDCHKDHPFLLLPYTDISSIFEVCIIFHVDSEGTTYKRKLDSSIVENCPVIKMELFVENITQYH